jgi:hypothetical protein
MAKLSRLWQVKSLGRTSKKSLYFNSTPSHAAYMRSLGQFHKTTFICLVTNNCCRKTRSLGTVKPNEEHGIIKTNDS